MEEFNQKIAIVTGANHGIGLETTIGLAAADHHVVMAYRNQTKAIRARDSIIAKVPRASLDVRVVDLGEPASVRAFAGSFCKDYQRLDVLINNAGILLSSEKTSADGIELQFATNHLGHFLLTALVIDLMPDQSTSRIVHLSSLAHNNAMIHFDDLSCGGSGLTAYGQSKLSCLIFGEELDRRLRANGRHIKSIIVHPGGSDSGLFDDMSRWQYYLFKLIAPFVMNSQKSAAKSSLYAALSPDADGGTYYGPQGFKEFRGRVGEAKRDSKTTDTALAERLWTRSEELTNQTLNIHGVV